MWQATGNTRNSAPHHRKTSHKNKSTSCVSLSTKKWHQTLSLHLNNREPRGSTHPNLDTEPIQHRGRKSTDPTHDIKSLHLSERHRMATPPSRATIHRMESHLLFHPRLSLPLYSGGHVVPEINHGYMASCSQPLGAAVLNKRRISH